VRPCMVNGFAAIVVAIAQQPARVL
jgi:hypothetical protein